LPVVALKDDAFKEMVIDNENGFLIKGGTRGIFAKRVLEILNKPSLYQRFSATSQRIAHNFSEENQAKKLLDIYKSLVRK
jgi:glycosyltransferase involved in cell wall biosynthesis